MRGGVTRNLMRPIISTSSYGFTYIVNKRFLDLQREESDRAKMRTMYKEEREIEVRPNGFTLHNFLISFLSNLEQS